MTTRAVSYQRGAWDKCLTDKQREFAQQAIERIAASADPKKHEDLYGAVKALKYNHAGEYAYKPCQHLRLYGDMEIRVIFKGTNQIVIIKVAPRDSVY